MAGFPVGESNLTIFGIGPKAVRHCLAESGACQGEIRDEEGQEHAGLETIAI